ncbi:MAG TPA: hypothetical protein VIS96_07155 [Terrimicrobiaceae bacterium]
MNKRNPIAKRFYARLDELGWKIRDVAGFCGYSEIHIYGLLSGARKAKLARAKVEAAIGIPLWGDTGYIAMKPVGECGAFPKNAIIVIPESTARILALGSLANRDYPTEISPSVRQEVKN